MKTGIVAALVTLTVGSVAHGGGVDRSGQSVAAIFEPGRYFEITLGAVSPDIRGVATEFTGAPGTASGDMAERFLLPGAAYKQSFGNGIDAAVIFDQPFGADVLYPSGSGYFAAGSQAELRANAITGVVRYRFDSNVSLLGGLRYQTFAAQALAPFITAGSGTEGVVDPGAAYSADGARDGGLGYLLGVAYERPDIALRVALTYNSRIAHRIDTVEHSAFGGPVRTVTETETPQSVNLEFQSGLASNTLLFGAVRWVDWSAFKITPQVYEAIAGEPLVFYDKDSVTFSLGIGHRLTENWSIAATVGYEEPMGGFSSNLGPTDGQKFVGFAASFTHESMTVTGGIRYVDLGDTQTTLGGDVPVSDFRSNRALGFGLKLAFAL